MPFYSRIDGRTKDGQRTARRLLDLKTALATSGIPKRHVDGRLLVATWNIREFGKSKHGLRAYEPLYYIAEIIDHFDLVPRNA
jgi:hypothetical protein